MFLSSAGPPMRKKITDFSSSSSSILKVETLVSWRMESVAKGWIPAKRVERIELSCLSEDALNDAERIACGVCAPFDSSHFFRGLASPPFVPSRMVAMHDHRFFLSIGIASSAAMA